MPTALAKGGGLAGALALDAAPEDAAAATPAKCPAAATGRALQGGTLIGWSEAEAAAEVAAPLRHLLGGGVVAWRLHGGGHCRGPVASRDASGPCSKCC